MEKELKCKPLAKKALYRDEIRERIRDAILSGGLAPGERIVETKWARDLGVSQSPVREAIRELEVVGLIENIPYQGSYVRKITKGDIKDSYLVRMSLEVLGMKDAVRGVTPESLSEIYATMIAMEQAAEDREFEEYIRLDDLFHQQIMEISKNKMLLRVWQQCDVKQWTHIGTKFSEQTLQHLARRHRAIYEALELKDEEYAVKEVRRHLLELIDELDARGE